jgi:(R,R)-butanediol dehydrogenase/meso-butanediol dehydrogenase/diacetyl reductase
MQAGLVTGRERVELLEFPYPEPSPGKAVVEIALCGICGTDVHAWQSGQPYNPAICGHEWTGTVAAADRAASVREGDCVAIGIAPPCGRCVPCQRGNPAWCERAFAGLIGAGPLASPHGGFAAALAIEADRLYPVQAGLNDIEAALLEPATIALHAVRRTRIRAGDRVVVLGAGPIGLLVVQCARVAGAGVTVVVEPQAVRGAIANKLGANQVFDPQIEGWRAGLADLLGTDGADVVFECAGVPATIDLAVSLVRRGGYVSLVGVPTAPATINASAWLAREIRLVTSLGYQREEFALAQDLIADHRLVLEPLHSATVPLTGLSDAFATLGGTSTAIKILVDPRQ